MKEQLFSSVCTECYTKVQANTISALVALMLKHDEDFHPECVEEGKAAIQKYFGEDLAREQDS